MDAGIPSGVHAQVGPITKVNEHGPVTIIYTEREAEGTLFVCLDCGYTTLDIRRLVTEDCDPEENEIAQPWREYIEENGFPPAGSE